MLKIGTPSELKFQKNVFDELRAIVLSDEKASVLNDENMIKAITLNENLKSLGFCLNPDDIIRVARSEEMDIIFSKIKGFTPEIKAKPMYPDFPSQVMEIDEATYRFHQMVHYFSTYHVEALFGVEIKVGWMPKLEDTPKLEDEKALLNAKVLSVYAEHDVVDVIVRKIANKTERFTISEAELVRYISLNNPSVINTIPFKENIYTVCMDAIQRKDVKELHSLLFSLCAHVGDVFKVLQMHLSATKYKNLSTSIKRVFVNVLEDYPLADFEENVMQSLVQKEQTIKLLERLSYNRFSKKSSYKATIAMLRNKQLTSWFKKVENLIADENNSHLEILEFIGKRPGILYRMIVRLYRLGFTMDEISCELLKHVDSYKPQSIISAMNQFISFDNDTESGKVEEKEFFLSINKTLLHAVLKNKETCIKGKRVYIDEGNYSFEHSVIETNEKSQEGGYIRSGLAFKIPDQIKKIRYFVYWNDERRVDIDLHAIARTGNSGLFNIGWNSNYYSGGIVMSGDIVHSDAAEYIDIDIDSAKEHDVKFVTMELDSYLSIPFDEIETIYAGLLAVGENIEKNVKLYNSKNVFFRHDLKTDYTHMIHSLIDIENRVLIPFLKPIAMIGLNTPSGTDNRGLALSEYLHLLFSSQNVEIVNCKENADFVLSLDKTVDKNNISLIDENYFLES